ncbi:unnamed protein product [Adineta steineri]|uniref:Transmembrane protein n=1 Tax=Adineta steineri TaxID=433720 RepID=A0A819RFW9_9BILA|nr:unnamed protein product [Adineta steineri]
MSWRQILIGCLVFATLVIPIVQLSFGFHYVDNPELCRIQKDIMIIMAIGGVFQALFFAAAFGFIYRITPTKYKAQKNQTVAQQSAKGNNRASFIIIGCITGIIGACAIIFFVILQIQVYKSFPSVQSSDSSSSSYCLFSIFSSAFGLIIATYVAFLLLFLVSIILLCGICAPTK